MSSPNAMPFNHEVILVVEDSLPLLRKLAFLLEIAGFSVLTATDGDKALDVLRYQTPDLILADMDMPGMNGCDLLEKVHANRQWQHIPVILASDKYDLDDLLHALDLGAADYLPKPYDIYDVLDSIKRTLEDASLNDHRLAG
ncbi:MAG: response regulator [Anaerolineae bacterium]|nr:response regulator [Anaerolineae bacterium]